MKDNHWLRCGLFLLAGGWFMTNSQIVLAASTIGGGHSGGLLWNMIIILGFIAIVYFMLILPQKRQSQAHQAMLNNLRVGDEVVTNGGMIGKIARIEENEILLTVGQDHEIRVLKGLVSDLYANVLKKRDDEKSTAKSVDSPLKSDSRDTSSTSSKKKKKNLKSAKMLSGRKSKVMN